VLDALQNVFSDHAAMLDAMPMIGARLFL